MRKLHLLRHAKSSWGSPELSDRERGLNKRGQRDAPRMGEALARRMVAMPVAVSPARRAQLTLAGLCAAWPALADLSHRTEEDLYTFAAEDILEWLQLQDDAHAALFVIGHNPALTDLANWLAGEASLANLPTAGYLELSLDIDRWRDMGQGCGQFEFSLFPRNL